LISIRFQNNLLRDALICRALSFIPAALFIPAFGFFRLPPFSTTTATLPVTGDGRKTLPPDIETSARESPREIVCPSETRGE